MWIYSNINFFAVKGQKVTQIPFSKSNILALGYPNVTFTAHVVAVSYSKCIWTYQEKSYLVFEFGTCSHLKGIEAESSCIIKEKDDNVTLMTNITLFQPTSTIANVCISCDIPRIRFCSSTIFFSSEQYYVDIL